MTRAPIFIAEASSNHDRDLGRALAFVDAAADAGCDAVKFQLFKIDRMFAPEILSRSAKHRARAQWELPRAHLGPLADQCAKRGIQFSCTPFYLEAVAELLPYVDFYKIASYELLVTPLLEACAATQKPIVLSTGMATMEEIVTAAETLKRAGAVDLTLAALRVGLSDAGGRSQPFRHRSHPRCHRLQGRLVGSHKASRSHRTRRASLGRDCGGIPSRPRRRRRGICVRPLLAA